MSGVALVGYSGSLIKDAIKVVTPLLAPALGNHHDASPIFSAEEPELSRVLIGKSFRRHLTSKSKFQTSSLPRYFLHPICASIVSRLLRYILAIFFR